MLFIKEKSHTLTPSGTVGGHTLTINELASHSHLYSEPVYQYCHHRDRLKRPEMNLTDGSSPTTTGLGSTHSDNFKSPWDKSLNTGENYSHSHTFEGTTFSFDNNPPYKVVYCFYRVS